MYCLWIYHNWSTNPSQPNLLSSDGTAALSTSAFSHSGEYFAYGISLSVRLALWDEGHGANKYTSLGFWLFHCLCSTDVQAFWYSDRESLEQWSRKASWPDSICQVLEYYLDSRQQGIFLPGIDHSDQAKIWLKLIGKSDILLGRSTGMPLKIMPALKPPRTWMQRSIITK